MIVLDQMALLRKAILVRHRGPESDSATETSFVAITEFMLGIKMPVLYGAGSANLLDFSELDAG